MQHVLKPFPSNFGPVAKPRLASTLFLGDTEFILLCVKRHMTSLDIFFLLFCILQHFYMGHKRRFQEFVSRFLWGDLCTEPQREKVGRSVSVLLSLI